MKIPPIIMISGISPSPGRTPATTIAAYPVRTYSWRRADSKRIYPADGVLCGGQGLLQACSMASSR